MLESTVSNGFGGTDSLGLYLRSALPDEYLVVSEPVVPGHPVDAVVVGPQGLFVLDAKEWEGHVRPMRSGPWRERSASGQVLNHRNPAAGARKATSHLRGFLRDEFPSLKPEIHHFVVLTDPGAELTAYGAVSPSCAKLGDLAGEIAAVSGSSERALGRKARESLAAALHERQLTAGQRASQPFIFRSSGFLGLGRKAWTVLQVVKQMDKYPEEGIHHLRNGSLERWLSDQGAHHLAKLAREVVRESPTDPRAALETFLLGTGLVRSPRIAIRPRRIDFGYVLSGEKATRRLCVLKGPGRGYLIGAIHASHPWLRVEPASFADSLESVVSIDTEPLLITEQPSKASVEVQSNASDRPIVVPVRIHVEPVPAPVSRYLIRPLVGLLVAAFFGAMVGWYVGGWGIRAPAWLTQRTSPPLTARAGWALLAALSWALLGAIRGIYQPQAWPTAYAIRRWLSQTLFWGVAPCLVTAVAFGLTSWLVPDVEFSAVQATCRSALVAAAIAAVVPGTVGEILRGRTKGKETSRQPRRVGLRTCVLGGAAVALVFIGVTGARVAVPALERYALHATTRPVQEWASQRLSQCETVMNGLRDELYVRLYDRRAPAGSQPVAPEPAVLPDEAE